MRFGLAMFVSFFLVTVLLAEPTSKDNVRLKKALARFPEADANKDGVLTLTEAKTFQRKNGKAGNKRNGQRPQPKAQTVSGTTIEKDREIKGYNGLYMGHSFFRPAAEKLLKIIPDTNVTNHTEYIVMSGGQSGSPGKLWENESKRVVGQKYLDAGNVDLLAMTYYSPEDSSLEHYAKWFDYALVKNPSITFMVAIPWSKNPHKLTDASIAEKEENAVKLYDKLIIELRKRYPKNTLLFCPYGLGMYELVRRLKSDRLPGVKYVLNPDKRGRGQSKQNNEQLVNDELGHGGELVSYLNALIWLQTIYDIDVSKLKPQRVDGLPDIDLNKISVLVNRKIAPFNALYNDKK